PPARPSSSSSTSSTPPVRQTDPEPTAPTQEDRMTDRTKPEIDHPEGDAPTELISVDEIIGDGEEAGRGDVVDVHYVGVSHSTGEQFDASWDRGAPLRFQLGVGQVVSGWDQGVQGMKVGGRRRLALPASLGYGAQGAPPVIAPNESLIFVCDLVAVHKR